MSGVFTLVIMTYLLTGSVGFTTRQTRDIAVEVNEALRNLSPVWCNFTAEMNRIFYYTAFYNCSDVYHSNQSDPTLRLSDFLTVRRSVRNASELVCSLQEAMTPDRNITECCINSPPGTLAGIVKNLDAKLLDMWRVLNGELSDPIPTRECNRSSISSTDFPQEIQNSFLNTRIFLNSLEDYPENFRN